MATYVNPTTIPGVNNYANFAPFLHRGSQPTAAGFRELKRRGVVTVIDLREEQDDAPALQGSGILNYLWMPLHTVGGLDFNEVAGIVRQLVAPQNAPVFFHCMRGADRTGTLAATYRMTFEGWSYPEMLDELYRFQYDQSLFMILEFLRNLDVDAMRQRVTGGGR